MTQIPNTEQPDGWSQIPSMEEPNGWGQIIEPSGETSIAQAVPEALLHLRTALATGAPWQRAILETMGEWTTPEEMLDGRRYRYLLLGEAFDWLLLAERLCADVDGAIPVEEKERFLFSGQIPDTVDEDQFRDYLGPSKFRAYMNFRYGVVLEEALQLVAEEEVRKQHLSRSYSDTDELTEESYTHLYQKPRSELLKTFQKETKKDRRRNLSLSDIKEFTYWLHKRRINLWDPARVASDTRKAIRRLELLEKDNGLPGGHRGAKTLDSR